MLKRTAPRTLKSQTDQALPAGKGRTVKVDAIPDNLAHRRRAIQRQMLDARHLQQAIEHVVTLPQPGESLHFIVDGRFEPCDLIPATRKLSHPAVIARLDVTTLGLNSDNVACIANGLDQGKVLFASVLVSHYFKSAEPGEYEYLRSELASRGSRVNAMRSHAKLILMEMTDGNHYTIEGSGNLRACRSIEQFVMTNDRELLLFHRSWIDQYIDSRGDGTDLNLKARHDSPQETQTPRSRRPTARGTQ